METKELSEKKRDLEEKFVRINSFIKKELGGTSWMAAICAETMKNPDGSTNVSWKQLSSENPRKETFSTTHTIFTGLATCLKQLQTFLYGGFQVEEKPDDAKHNEQSTYYR